MRSTQSNAYLTVCHFIVIATLFYYLDGHHVTCTGVDGFGHHPIASFLQEAQDDVLAFIQHVLRSYAPLWIREFGGAGGHHGQWCWGRDS